MENWVKCGSMLVVGIWGVVTQPTNFSNIPPQIFKNLYSVLQRSLAAAKHVDKNNKGHSYIIGLGNYKGGELVFSDKKSPNYGVH
eukprot:SAG31_NODE_12853_length_911_cov_2.016010_1_plen_84_part_10